MDKEEQKEKLTQNIMDTMLGELKEAHADAALGMECVLAATMRLTLMVPRKPGAPTLKNSRQKYCEAQPTN